MRLLRDLEARLRGWPDELLTVGLLTVALFLVIFALTAPATAKAAALAWVLFP